MTTLSASILSQTYNQLSRFASLENFWDLFDNAFGKEYNHKAAASLHSQWQKSDFSQLPQIEIIDSSILGNANGAYASSNNTIYLSNTFLETATYKTVSAVILEEIGHFVDAKVNRKDTPGDEGKLFSSLVRGQNISSPDLERIKTENDWATLTVEGQRLAVEQAVEIVLTVNTTADQNDGSAGNGLSLRDAILIANNDLSNYYTINLTGGQTYNLTALGSGDTGGDLDIRNNILIQSTGAQPATINAQTLSSADRVFEVQGYGYLLSNNIVVTGGSAESAPGGGIRINENAQAYLFNTQVINNTSDFYVGVGIYNSQNSALTLVNSTVSNNVDNSYSGTRGGGIFNAGEAILRGTKINNNYTQGDGGGIYNQGNLTLYSSTIYNNESTDYDSEGGGIYNSRNLNVFNSTLSGNQAGGTGGISTNGTGVTNIVNTTITNNSGLYSGDFYSSIGGIYAGGTTNIKNTIIAGNFGEYPDILGSINGNSYNLIGNTNGASGTIGTGTDIVNPNPGLGALQNNGGLTPTHALLTGSPAINAGNNSLIPADTEDLDDDGDTTEPIPYDQRGLARVSGSSVDIGAFEVQSVALPTLSINDVTITEGNTGTTNAVFTVTRSGTASQQITVNYATANGTATAGSDFTNTTGTLTFATNETTKTISIPITGDTTVEANETFFVNLSNATNATIADAQGQGTINNDDLASITLAVSPASVTEDGTTNLVYTFTRTGSTTNALTVNYGVAGTATFNTDYSQSGAASFTGNSGTITFAAGASTKTLTIDPTADTTIESNETVALTLATGTGYSIGTTTPVTGTITDDDSTSSITINLSPNQTIVEGNTSPQNATYTVSLSSASTQTITVNYATANGTATATSDYTSTSGTLTFNPGVTSSFINIPIVNNSLNEADETFTLNLSSPTNASLGTTNTVTTTITDTLTASVTTTLPANVENLTLTGTEAINGTGNAGNNILQGNSANNTLAGANGNDTYSFVATTALGTDTITETTGTDTINFSGTTVATNVNLGVTTSQTVNSNLKLILSANNVIENATGGTGNDRLTGNTLNNTLDGSSGNDQLQGLAGNDTLLGGAGIDTLTGGSGDDLLWGGLNDDLLTGGLGNDKYQFKGTGAFSNTLGVDYINDFEVGQDQIWLSKTTFNAVTNTVGQPLTDFAVVSDDEFVDASSARIVYSQSTGSLFYNQNGNVIGATSVFEFARLGNPEIILASSDFSLVS